MLRRLVGSKKKNKKSDKAPKIDQNQVIENSSKSDQKFDSILSSTNCDNTSYNDFKSVKKNISNYVLNKSLNLYKLVACETSSDSEVKLKEFNGVTLVTTISEYSEELRIDVKEDNLKKALIDYIRIAPINCDDFETYYNLIQKQTSEVKIAQAVLKYGDKIVNAQVKKWVIRSGPQKLDSLLRMNI